MNQMRRVTPIWGHSGVGAFETVPTLSNPQGRVVIPELPVRWKTINDRFNELCRLPRGWNGYAAPPVELGTASFALAMLKSCCGPDAPTPSIVPGVNGDLQIEWHFLGGDIELHVRAPNDVHAWRQAVNAHNDGEELLLTQDFTSIVGWIRDLAGWTNASVSAAA